MRFKEQEVGGERKSKEIIDGGERNLMIMIKFFFLRCCCCCCFCFFCCNETSLGLSGKQASKQDGVVCKATFPKDVKHFSTKKIVPSYFLDLLTAICCCRFIENILSISVTATTSSDLVQ